MKRKKGISLIVLIITIIVITILAGAVLLNVSINNPIEQANEAKFKHDVKEFADELNLWLNSLHIEDRFANVSNINATKTSGNYNGKTLQQIISSMDDTYADKFEIQASKLVYIGENNKEEDYITQIGLTNGESLAESVPMIVVGTIATENSTVDGKIAKYNNPIVPTGFKAINDGTVWPTGWNDGLVIEDINGNQFVWVPIDKTNVLYEKWCTTGQRFDSEYISDNALPEGILNENDQIDKYGGFYIARYEAGKINTDTLTIKKSQLVWVSISYNNAKLKAESMYKTNYVKSGIVTGTQWDTLLKWIQSSGTNVTNGATWGNYIDSAAPAASGSGTRQTSGYSEYWKAKNIYDVAGNVWEWTNEKYESNIVKRSGRYSESSASYPVTYRSCSSAADDVSSGTSFRLVLYVL